MGCLKIVAVEVFLFALLVGFIYQDVLKSSVTPNPLEDDLFKLFHFNGKVQTTEGMMDVPFHAYKADIVMLQGLCDADYVAAAYEGHDYSPYTSSKGSPCQIWVVEYEKSNCGPYKEIIVVFFGKKDGYPASDYVLNNPNLFTQIKMTYFDATTTPFVYRLWLNETAPIAYGRELLGYDKYVMGPKSDIGRSGGSVNGFNLVDETGDLLIKGAFTRPSEFNWILTQLGHLPDLLGALEIRDLFQFLFDRFISIRIMLPKGILPKERFPGDATPMADVVSRTNPDFYPWGENDSLNFGGELRKLNFTPLGYTFVEEGRFVLQPPDNSYDN